MLARSVERIEALPDDALVLDVGGWARPLARADWVLDLMPYETRGRYGRDGTGEERFGPGSWVCRDVCEREPWPFEDDRFDFVACSHTLEDVRDPIFVCSELVRVGKAGYIEAPSRLEEQTYGFQGPWVGWGHHHWLVDVEDGRVTFVFKHHVIHGLPGARFPADFRAGLQEDERVTTLWWEGGFQYGERLFYEAEDLERYLTEVVARRCPRRPPPGGRSGLRRLRRRR
jgi:Methyltransferase domain